VDAAVVTTVTSVSTVVSAGSTFTLTTTSAGAANGTSGNDAFVALDNALTQFVVDGGDGADSLRATISATDTYDVSNVEALTFKVTAGVTIDMDDFTGEESVAVSGTGATVLDNFADAVALTSSMTGTVALTVNVASDVESIAVTLSKATSTGLLTIDDVTSITVTGTNDDDTISLDGDAVETLTLLGANDMAVVTPVGAELVTIDASGMTGALTLGVTANDVAVTTGTGGDVVTFASASLTDDDSVDLGDGADTLVLTAATNAYASVATGETLSVTGVETLALVAGAAGDAIDFDMFEDPTQFSTVLVTSTLDAANITLTDIQTANVSIRNTDNVSVSDTINAVTYDLKDSSGTADAVAFTLTNRDTTENFTITTLTAAGIESMTINTVGGTDGDIDITNFTATSLESLTITGDADLTLGAFATTVETVDASTSTGDINITFAGADVTVTGGAGADTFIMGTSLSEDDSIDGGDGDDIVTVTAINDGAVLDLVLDLDNVEEFTFTETADSDSAFTADLRNSTSIAKLNVVLQGGADTVITFENITGDTLEVDLSGVLDADGDTLVLELDNDGTADSLTINLATDTAAGALSFEGTITANDFETITIDVTETGTATDDNVFLIADLNASSATTYNFTNDDTYDAGDNLVITAALDGENPTIDLTGWGQDVGADAGTNVLTAAGFFLDEQAGILGQFTVGITLAPAEDALILLSDGKTTATNETVISLGAIATQAGIDIIRFINTSADSTDDIGDVVITAGFTARSATTGTAGNYTVIDFSEFTDIGSVSDLTLSAAPSDDGGVNTIITSSDFAGVIVLIGVTASELTADNFTFA
jgi:hypothetical protein